MLRQTSCSPKWKFTTTNTIIAAQLFYGLETVQLNQVQLRQLDSMQIRILRRILKIPPAFISHVSNEEVMRQAKTRYKKIKPWSETYTARTVTLLGHLYRESITDPVRKSVIMGNYHLQVNPIKKVGRPANNWVVITALNAAKTCGIHGFDHRQEEHQRLLYEAALRREF